MLASEPLARQDTTPALQGLACWCGSEPTKHADIMGVGVVSKTLSGITLFKMLQGGKGGSELFFLIPCRYFKHLPFKKTFKKKLKPTM